VKDSAARKGQEDFTIVRRQLPLVLCEAQTVHKSQSKTYPKVAVYIGSDATFGHDRSILYTAMGRVTSLTGLYLFGDIPNFFTNNASRKKAEEPVWQKEMRRLREQEAFKNHFDFLPTSPNTEPLRNKLNVICHNIQTYLPVRGLDRQKCVQMDWGYQEADVILLVEAHLNVDHLRREPDLLRTPPNFKRLHITMGEGWCTAVGQICFVRESIEHKIRHIACNASDEIDATHAFHTRREYNDLAEFSLIRYDHCDSSTVYICFVYIHPEAAQKYQPSHINELKEFLNKHIFTCSEYLEACRLEKSIKICIMGDFNCDFNEWNSNLKIETFEHHFNMYPTIFNTMTYFKWTKKNHTTNEQILKARQLDWAFATNTTDKISLRTLPYECWFSDHVALFNIFEFKD
jgi:hypothetical protein